MLRIYVIVYLKATDAFLYSSDLRGVPWKASNIKKILKSEEADECPLGFPNSLEQDIGIILLDITQGLG